MNNYCTTGGRVCANQPEAPCQTCQPEPTTCNTTCAEGFRQLLELLCKSGIRPLIDFGAFSFITDYYILGTALIAPTTGTISSDNLAAPAATYVCSRGNCSSIAVSGSLYPPVIGAETLDITALQVSLCNLVALSFDAIATGEVTEPANFQTISQILSQFLQPQHENCCALSPAIEVMTSAAMRTATLTAGPLIIQNATILGELDNVLVLANSTDYRFYFVYADRIGFVG